MNTGMVNAEQFEAARCALAARDARLTQADADACAWVWEVLPVPPRAGWQVLQRTIDGYAARATDRLSVIVSASVEADGRRWLHVSYARANRMPDYEDTQRVRRLFIGEDRYALAVWPPKDRYVNLHRYTLHLWSCLDEYPLPEFSGMVGSVRTV